jgi:hypothetical protein
MLVREAEALDAANSLGRMFGASDSRIAALAGYIERQMDCALCLAEGLETLFRNVERFPAPKHVLAVYREANESPRHAMHQGQSARATEVGRIETFWHTEGCKAVERVVGDHQLALFIAAQMWWQRVPPETDYVAAEMALTDVWEIGARNFTTSQGGVTQPLIDAAFRRARKAASAGDAAVTRDELNLVLA